MRSRRLGPAIFFLTLAAVLLGSGVASARPMQDRVGPTIVATTSVTRPGGHEGRHCRTHPEPVASDPADL
jgi:hypothetical protein